MSTDTQHKQFFDYAAALGQRAFPHVQQRGDTVVEFGLSARQYAAIALRVPNSGDDCLDAMIQTSLRDEFANNALQAVVAAILPQECHRWQLADFAKEAYALADVMIAERAK